MPAGLSSHLAWAEPMVMALPEEHPRAASWRLAFAPMADEPLVIFPRHVTPSLHDAVLGFYSTTGRTPQVAQEAIQMQTIVNPVSAGIGVAWVPQSLMQLQRPGVVYRSVRGARTECHGNLVWREPAPPVVQRFVAHVAAHGQRRQSVASSQTPRSRGAR